MEVTKFGRTFKIEFWQGQQLLGQLDLDTETEEIVSPSIIPRIVLTTVYCEGDTAYIVKNEDLNQFYRQHNQSRFGFWNAAFDMPVTEKSGAFSFNEALIQDRCDDGQILLRLLSLAENGDEAKTWNLSGAALKYLGEELEKKDSVRLTFGQYISENSDGYVVRYDEIPKEHLAYACIDAIATKLIIYILKEKIRLLPTSTNLAQKINLMGDIALAQVHRNGICIDLPYVEKIKSKFVEMKDKNADVLSTYGYVRGKKGNTKVFETIAIQEKFELPLTKSGRLNSSKACLEPYKKHPFVSAYLDFKGFEKQNNFLKELNAERIHPKYNSIKRTVRTSCSKPNIQQMPKIGGIRECFVPADDHVFVDCDYAAIELAAIASITKRLFKKSVMADLLNEGRDLHKYAASNIYKIKETDVTKDQRQLAKALNFGLVANMSGETFIGQAAKYGVVVTAEEGEVLKDQWANVFPEMRRYWRYGFGKNTCVTDTGMIRGNCTYTMYLNLPMQLKVAEGAKIALYMLYREGFKVVAFIHDQVLVECKKETAEQDLIRVKQIMIDGMSKVILGVKVGVEGAIKERFEK